MEGRFGESAIFDFVAVNEDFIVGTAIYYTRYSTWKEGGLFEDLVVRVFAKARYWQNAVR